MPVRYIDIEVSDENQRLDNFLMKHLKGVPRSRIYKMFRKGEVRVNKGRVKPAYRLKIGDCIRIPPVRLKSKTELVIPQAAIDNLEKSIIYENSDLLVLNKPPGIAVHAGTNIKYGVIEILKASRAADGYLELAHRIDRYTSGCLVLAKDSQTLKNLHQQLRSGNIEKYYHCLVAGHINNDPGRIETGLTRSGQGIRKTVIDAEGTPAISTFKLIEPFSDCSYMEVNIETGFTHQIRVHANYLGHPVLGDDVYGDFSANKVFRVIGVKRQLLHASQLSLSLHPNEQRLTFNAPLTADFQSVLKKLRY